MAMIHFIVALITFSASNGGETNNELCFNNIEELNEGSSCEKIISTKLLVLNTGINSKFDAIKQDIEILQKKIPDNIENKLNIVENIIQKLDAQDNKRVAQLGNMAHQYDTIENSIRNLTEKLTCKLDTSTLAHLQNIYQKLTEMEKNVLQSEQKIYAKIDSLQNHVKIEPRAECKKRVARGYGFEPLIRMDSSLMNNIKLSKDSDGNVVNFEMKIGIKGPADALIQLSSDSMANSFHYEIGIGGHGNNMTYFRYKDNDELPANPNTPNILSTTEYKYFLIKISSGTLELFREGSYTPLLKRSDVRFKTFKYFGFSSWFEHDLTFLFDCAIEPRAECKKRVARGYGFEPLIRMDSSLMNNIKLSKDSDGNVVNFEMKIGIKGPADALIQLSSDSMANSFHYEIGIGGHGNNMTYFRYKNNDELPASPNTPNILSTTEYKYFLIKISSGTLELFREGSYTPLLKRSDVRFKTFKYFGFSSWFEHDLTFLFDC